MTALLSRIPVLYRRPSELARRVLGSVLGFVAKAYGAAAALSVALSDAETVGGKAYDAVNAVPNLVERYQQARYVVEHREQIQTALDYVNENAPDPAQLESAARTSAQTLDRLTTTYGELNQAWETVTGIRLSNVLESLPKAKDHVDRAWSSKPDLASIEQLTTEAQQVAPFLRQLGSLEVDFPRLYGNLLSVLDNFASDEIGATLFVMAAALGVAWVLSLGAGFWGRRGRPGFVTATLHGWGARRFRPWYVRNLEHALGPSLYAVARERVQRDIVADPRAALDPDTHDALERYFAAERAGPRSSPEAGR